MEKRGEQPSGLFVAVRFPEHLVGRGGDDQEDFSADRLEDPVQRNPGSAEPFLRGARSLLNPDPDSVSGPLKRGKPDRIGIGLCGTDPFAEKRLRGRLRPLVKRRIQRRGDGTARKKQQHPHTEK